MSQNVSSSLPNSVCESRKKTETKTTLDGILIPCPHTHIHTLLYSPYNKRVGGY